VPRLRPRGDVPMSCESDGSVSAHGGRPLEISFAGAAQPLRLTIRKAISCFTENRSVQSKWAPPL
jgi:hypothetical protein